MANDTVATDQYWDNKGYTGLVLRGVLRSLQFIFAIVVAILYGIDLHNATVASTGIDSSWIYAEFVVAVSMLTCILHLFLAVTRFIWCLWDWVVFILWVAQFGVFGTIYIGGKQDNDVPDFKPSTSRMHAAVWIDMISMVLWFASAVQGIAWCVVLSRTRKGARDVEAYKLESHSTDRRSQDEEAQRKE
ncbi:hypothetical protein F4805DRAFT_442981 [Annulohypoxylon moriforme]|nr:hypothetical protein F4805DRAFT_442981 [Annulohypoxylon moriforme]